jgi:hypothetical protein
MNIGDGFLWFGLGTLAGALAYIYDDDDGVVTFWGNWFHSWAIVPLIGFVGASMLWAFEAIDGWVVLASLAVLVGWLAAAYVMSIVWPTWAALAAWIASLAP